MVRDYYILFLLFDEEQSENSNELDGTIVLHKLLSNFQKRKELESKHIIFKYN